MARFSSVTVVSAVRYARACDGTPDRASCGKLGGSMAKARRATHRSVTGTKLYAVRDASGRFQDIQTYARAHRADLAKTSKTEKTARKKAVRKTAKKR